ncbi:DsbA family oxidoreductase [Natronococcus occultus]|uniref:Putative dithiol-disulfide isomerase involved in polyketide biosynthesis n=1 Tax=Natronococcus occultus SP4 TaxID=694430 RepID=L0JWG0_9EURY|nr:DsbA family oxidoreductase [Natronococcus occultus]AGB36198.1 putative dithiol-disulfide isomerase involved in polyketide biosynthesis [Natronococcus occultus SP4]
MSEIDAADRLTIYADYVCPFCYLGKQSLEQYRESREDALELEWHPFDLRSGKRNADGSIDHDADDGKDEAYFEQARENVRRLQAEYGVEMSQEIAADVDSLNAQLASWHVSKTDPDRWAAFDAAIYEALWQDGRDIGDPDVLATIAEDVGLAPGEIRDAIDDDGLRAELEERFADARQRGVTGVPTFVHEGRAARGAVPPAQLEALLEGE